MRLLMIHGRAQGGKSPAALRKQWMDSLARGLARHGKSLPRGLEVDFPYYGDILDDFARRARLPRPRELTAKGAGEDRRFAAFTRSALEEMAEQQDISDAEIRARLPPGAAQEKGPENWEWVQAIVSAIDANFTPVSGFAIEQFLMDVYLYMTMKPVTRAVDAEVEKALARGPVIVVSHSLGTVVAYNVLGRHAGNMEMRKLVTVGSPLGIRAISSRLGRPRNAQCGWYNAYDKRDIVALNPLDGRYFPTNPAIKNDWSVRNATRNHHGATGYLDDKDVAAVIWNAMT